MNHGGIKSWRKRKKKWIKEKVRYRIRNKANSRKEQEIRKQIKMKKKKIRNKIRYVTNPSGNEITLNKKTTKKHKENNKGE